MGDVTLVLRDVREEAQDTKSFVFDAEGLAGATAGQYLIVKLDAPTDPRRGNRSFTMANAPTEDRVTITTRMRITSPFKGKLASLAPGDRLAAKGPFGKFVLHDGDAPALFLAGGIGVTPFRSMIRHAIDTGQTLDMTLLTSDRVPEAIPFREELEKLAEERRWFRLGRTVTRPDRSEAPWSGRIARIDGPWIEEHIRDAARVVAYICGPPAFVEAMQTHVQSIGVSDDRIRVEPFIGY